MSWLDQLTSAIPDRDALLSKAGLSLEAAGILAAMVAVMALIFLWGRYHARRGRLSLEKYRHAVGVIRLVKPERGLENNLEGFLELYEELIDSSVYSFYTLDPKNNNFVLKAVRHNARDFGKVRPSYSGLADYKKEDYHPPLSILADGQPEPVQRITEGEVPMYSLVLPGGRGMVRIGPARGKLRKKHKKRLTELSELIGHSLGALIDTENLTNKAEVVVASGRAIQQINEISLHSQHTVELMTRLSIQSIGAAGGLYLEYRNGSYELAVRAGLDDRTVDTLLIDQTALDWFNNLLSDNSYHLLTRDDAEFRQLPDYLTRGTTEAIAAVRVGEGQPHFMVFWFNKLGDQEEERTARSTIRLISDNIGKILALQASLARFSGTYTGILKGLAELLDNMSPYTVGYSELMSRYSIMVAKEIGLSNDEIADVALAAYLSNIGMLGITIDLYQKEGKYTEQEFELMKLHSEIGASIVRSTIGNERVASYILYHHERMDGNGYPAGIGNADIPVGSKIIAVVQTFLAKINGRKYRDPLPFHKALQTLRSAAGSQLDPLIVEAFINWYERKQRNPQFTGRSLGACWEMGCVPSSICAKCPVNQRTDVNCWEVTGNNCAAHGKKCETCFIRTEFVNRSEKLKA